MPSVVAFSYKATNEETEIIEKCLKILQKEFKIYNIPQYTINKGILVTCRAIVTFGTTAKIYVSGFLEQENLNINTIELPAPGKLTPVKINEADRKETFEKLTELKEELKSNIRNIDWVKPSVVDGLADKHFDLLKDAIEKDVEFSIEDKNQRILISENRREDENFDITISLSELYTIKQIVEILKPEKINLRKKETK